jgi:hypothetical protein
METVIGEQKVLQRNDLLKLLALATMLMDHLGYLFYPEQQLFRIIGRLAFPIFAYQIAMGYSHTSSLKKYTLRILGFAVITQVPFSFFNPQMKFTLSHFNVLFTFVIGIGLLWIYDMGIRQLRSFAKNKKPLQLLQGVLLLILSMGIIVLPELASFMIRNFYVEYGMLGMLLILFFHIFEKTPLWTILSIVLLYTFYGYYRVALWNSAYSAPLFWSNLFDYQYVWQQLDLQKGFEQVQRYYFNSWGALSLIFIFALEKLNTNWLRLNKYIGYIFYPAHMTLLLAIAWILNHWI